MDPPPLQIDRRIEDCAGGKKSGHRDEVVQPAGLAVGHRPPQRAGGELDVGIAEEKPVSGSLGGPVLKRVQLSQPSFRQLGEMDRGHPPIAGGELIDQPSTLVGGPIVDEHHFQVGIVIVQARSHRAPQRQRLVASGDDQRHQGPPGRLRRPLQIQPDDRAPRALEAPRDEPPEEARNHGGDNHDRLHGHPVKGASVDGPGDLATIQSPGSMSPRAGAAPSHGKRSMRLDGFAEQLQGREGEYARTGADSPFTVGGKG